MLPVDFPRRHIQGREQGRRAVPFVSVGLAGQLRQYAPVRRNRVARRLARAPAIFQPVKRPSLA